LGKRVVLNIEDQALILQPKMSGLVTLGDAPDEEHVRLRIEFRQTPEAHLIFWDRRGLGTVEMLSEAAIFDRIVSGRLGPDALEIDFDEFVKRLRKTRRPIKVALLDQKLLAGIGNLYASEILHVARIHPEQACDRISTAKLRSMYAAMQDILLDAIRHEGSTLSDGTYRNALNDPGSYQSRHLVYDRAEQECPTCESGRIRRIVQAQRSSFFCPKCQRRPAANRRQKTT
jgi:formamidopyrimidine-DNA glycosylase